MSAIELLEMRGESEPQMEFDHGLVQMLACPACHGDLRVNGEYLLCSGCGRRYPLVDGIPILIPERAEKGDSGLAG